ncbi:hypothetical protein DEU56DRAFT_800256 [Suillus clintonianus]|uniref:uncharacterized protein n=1 Tax=Suillus clintonianus TaxID=1904413 RepID=UPI001B85D483|nr:uncharacterized protein DEU56DRAFT_800256 [Suillus clintonianus]KAG2139226.1 hypothetical protein DEU56DRAFT_800256 [Suillus clintonianus]
MSTASEPEDLPPPYTQSGTTSFPAPPIWEPHFIDLSTQHPSVLLRKPLDPPPDCFSTPSPLRVKSNDFPPFRIPCAGNHLADGFRILYPSGLLEKHGIQQADWTRFLEDLEISARLAGQGLSAVGSRVPIAALPVRGIFGARAPGVVYDSQFTRSPRDEVQTLITVWNQSAFERRKLRVSLQINGGVDNMAAYELLVESL